MARSPASRALPDSRARLLAAAAAEFADRGYAGAAVDRIARRARLNKAMIYYHFPNKQALYRAVLQNTFRAVGVRVQAIAGGTLPPDRQIRDLLAAIATEAASRPHFPPIMLRELAEGGRHLDPATLAMMGGVLQTVNTILAHGRSAGAFRDVPLMVAYFSMVAPLVIFHAAAPIREGVRRATGMAAPVIDADAFVEALQDFVLRSLAADPIAPGLTACAKAPASPPKRMRRRKTRPTSDRRRARSPKTEDS